MTHKSFTISFPVQEPGSVKLDLLNIIGGTMRNLIQESVITGEFNRTFSIDLPAGLYYLRMTNAEKEQISKIIIL